MARSALAPLAVAACLGLSVVALSLGWLEARRGLARAVAARFGLGTGPPLPTRSRERPLSMRGAHQGWFAALSADLSVAGLCGLGAAGFAGVWGLAGAFGLRGFAQVACGAAAVVAMLWSRLARISARREGLKRQARGFVQELQLAAAAGDTAIRALTQAASRAGEPLRSSLMAALRAHQAGQPLLMALSGQQELTLLPEYRCLLQALWLHNETGASLSSLLADVVDRAEESLHLQRELAAKLGEARWTARVLEVVPVALYAYMQLTDPGALVPLREDAFGRQALWLGAGLWLLGMAVLARMQRPPHGSHTEV